MFVNHLLFTLRNRIHFSPHLRYSIKLCKCFRRQMALITRTVFLEIAACGELGKQRCCWFCKELLRWIYFFPPSLMHRKNIPQNLIKISTKSLLFKIFGSWGDFDSRIDTEVGSFLFVISLFNPLPSPPHVYAKPLHLQICGFLILWNSGISRELGEYANSQMEGC